MPTRVAFQTAMRAAAVSLLKDYADSASLGLQVYRARPLNIFPPCAFVDGMAETLTSLNAVNRQRVPRVAVVVLHGIFDHGDTVDQRDRFVDGFLDWVVDRYHEAGANTLIAPTEIEDIPAFVNDWMPPDQQRVYYATRITLEGYAGG